MIKKPVWVVEEVQPKEDYTLLLTFADGTKKVFDARLLLKKEAYFRLNELSFFLSAKAECGTVIWDDDLDVAPEYLYECSKSL